MQNKEKLGKKMTDQEIVEELERVYFSAGITIDDWANFVEKIRADAYQAGALEQARIDAKTAREEKENLIKWAEQNAMPQNIGWEDSERTIKLSDLKEIIPEVHTPKENLIKKLEGMKLAEPQEFVSDRAEGEFYGYNQALDDVIKELR